MTFGGRLLLMARWRHRLIAVGAWAGSPQSDRQSRHERDDRRKPQTGAIIRAAGLVVNRQNLRRHEARSRKSRSHR